MTPLVLAAVGAPRLVPVLAAEGLDVILQLADAGTTIALLVFLVKALWTGSIRRKDEVEAAELRVKEANARTEAERVRAEKAEQGKERIQEAVLKEQGLASMELSLQGKELVRSATRIQELIEKLIDAFLRIIEKR